MPQGLPSRDASTPWLSRDWEAQLVSEFLRDARVTVLYGDAGAGKTALLLDGVQPLLLRQCPDSSELVVFFDQWSADPLPALRRQLAALMCTPLPAEPLTLAALLRGWQARHGTHFLLLLDGFEKCLNQGASVFINELVDVINDNELAANVLIALRSEAEPGLREMKRRIPGFDRSWLRLPGWQQGARHQPEPPPPPPQPQPALTLVLPAVEPPAPVAQDETVPLELMAAPAPQAEPARSLSPPAPPTHRSGPAPLFKWLGAAAALLVASLFALQSKDLPVAQSPEVAAADLTPAPAPPSPSAAVAELVRSTATPPLQLNTDLPWLTPPGALAALNWPPGFQPLSEGPPLAVARYDALQAARKTPPPGGLQIVAPFVTEHLHVITRADSPMKALHDIEGRTLAVGPVQGADALTASALYQSLFGTALSPEQTRHLAPDDALNALLGARSIDAIVLTAAHPSSWLAGLDGSSRQAIKLLPLDENHPSAQRVSQRYLTGVAAGATTPTLAVMNFIVTTGPPTASTTEALRRFASRLCQQLPALRREGHAAWRSVNPALQLGAGWPYSPLTPEDWRTCSP